MQNSKIKAEQITHGGKNKPQLIAGTRRRTAVIKQAESQRRGGGFQSYTVLNNNAIGEEGRRNHLSKSTLLETLAVLLLVLPKLKIEYAYRSRRIRNTG